MEPKISTNRSFNRLYLPSRPSIPHLLLRAKRFNNLHKSLLFRLHIKPTINHKIIAGLLAILLKGRRLLSTQVRDRYINLQQFHQQGLQATDNRYTQVPHYRVLLHLLQRTANM